LNPTLELSKRIGCYLERQGQLVRDLENSHLRLDPPHDSALDELLVDGVNYFFRRNVE
jgi:hypothetical protein